MADNTSKGRPLRLVAAIIAGVFVGFFIFFGIALIVGLFNDTMGSNIPIDTETPGGHRDPMRGRILLESTHFCPDNPGVRDP
jgi:hypothetical protein